MQKEKKKAGHAAISTDLQKAKNPLVNNYFFF